MDLGKGQISAPRYGVQTTTEIRSLQEKEKKEKYLCLIEVLTVHLVI
jgi:hypothetical protein